jgi:hypothetical protein
MCWRPYRFPICFCVGVHTNFLFCFVVSQDPNGKMKFERTPDIPVIAGDGITYGVACLQVLDSSLEISHFVKEICIVMSLLCLLFSDQMKRRVKNSV